MYTSPVFRWSGVSLAGVDLLCFRTSVALDEAAPVEATVAPLPHHLLLHAVPTTAAHDATSVRSFGRAIACSSMCTKGPHVRVVGTVVGRRVQENQVLGRRDDRPATPDLQFSPFVQPDFSRRVILHFQKVSDLRYT